MKFDDRLRVSWPAEQLSVSQEALCSKKSVTDAHEILTAKIHPLAFTMVV
jgi:hypothetical protein